MESAWRVCLVQIFVVYLGKLSGTATVEFWGEKGGQLEKWLRQEKKRIYIFLKELNLLQ